MDARFRKARKIRALAAILGAAWATAMGAPAAAAPTRTLDDVLKDLSGGGLVILMRHASAPEGQAASVGLTEGCDFADGRGLDAKGFFQARFIGEFLRTGGVPIGMAFTSSACRAWDTARLVAAGAPVAVEPALATTDRSAVETFRTIVSTALAGGAPRNVLLVTHSNVLPLYADWGGEGEVPSGLILVVDPKDWSVRDKLNLDVDLSFDGAR
jgi:phosphohistidine phosphatase SixA